MLSPFRVLDLTDEKGQLGGKILADLGADVIRIEPPGGSSARNAGPFYHDVPHPEKSLNWFAFNAGKRGITLDIGTADGRDLFLKLVKTVDVVIESFDPDYPGSIGLDYDQLSAVRPDIVMTSITMHGREGPLKNMKTYDLQAQAMAATVYVTGVPEKTPVSLGGLQSYNQAGIQSAIGTLMALFHRLRTGEGQHVDVSVREAMLILSAVESPVTWWVEAGKIRQRLGSCQLIANLAHRWFYRCKDGYVIWLIQMGVLGRVTNAVMKWMDEEGMADELRAQVPDWTKFGLDQVSQEQITAWEGQFQEFFLTKTKQELLDGILKRGIMLCPVSSMQELMASPQLAARGYWTELEHPELGDKITYPGPYFQATGPKIEMKRRAPLIGEHNEEIYVKELGLTREQLAALKESGVI